MCVKTDWNRVRNMFATVLTTITTIWRPGLRLYLFKIPLGAYSILACFSGRLLEGRQVKQKERDY